MNFTIRLPHSHRRHCALALGAIVLFISASGCGKGAKSVPGLEDFHVGVLQSRLYVSFVSTTLKWDEGLTVPIPGLTDATASVSPDLASEGTVFQFAIGLQSLLNDGKPLPLAALPDGRNIPDIQDGKLPRWDTEIRKLKLSLFLSDDAFGLYVPLTFINKKGVTLPYMVTVTIKDERGNQLGKAYALPPKSDGTGSGLFVLLPYLGAEPRSASVQ
jgi:hypothetical protein